MKLTTHVIAIFSHIEGTNKLHVILAPSAEKAAKMALIENIEEEYRTEEYTSWVDGLGDDLESITQGAHEGELVISNILTLHN